MRELFLPTTDRGVLVQAIGLAIVAPVAIALTWRRLEVRTFVIGLVVAAAAWMALRTVH